ncbi:hypothetical protein LTR95_000328 [Oleoguttula sp. CCFEE 5521]
MPSVLIVGATRGLGQELANQYARREYSVYGTSRSDTKPKDAHHDIRWLHGVDVGEESAGEAIAKGLKGHKIDVLILAAGYFGKESFDEPDYAAELKMYKISAIGPVFITHALVKAGTLKQGSKVIIISSEAGSIGLRHESEGGGNFGHHASKAASNMVGKLLSFDLKDRDIAVGMAHPGFMRTEMTKGVGFDEFWDSGGAVTPDIAAKSLIEWIDEFGIEQTGEFWAPRGPGDIGTAEATLGDPKKLPTPLQLPW